MLKKRAVAAVMALSAFAAIWIGAENSPPSDVPMLDVSIDLAYLHAAEAGRRSASADVRLVNQIVVRDEAVMDFAVQGRYLYQINDQRTLKIADISDPAAPKHLGFCRIPGMPQELEVAGDRAYIVGQFVPEETRMKTSLLVIDVSDPNAPEICGYRDFPAPTEAGPLAIGDERVYMAGKSGGLRVVDVSDPSHMAPLGAYDPGGMVLYIDDSGDKPRAKTLHFVPGETPVPPGRLVGSSAVDVVLEETLAYLLWWDLAGDAGSLKIIDMSRPDAPKSIGLWPGRKNRRYGALAREGRRIYLGEANHSGACSLLVLDASDLTSPAAVARYPVPSGIEDICADGPLAVAGSYRGLRIFDVTNPNDPVPLADIAFPARNEFPEGGKEAHVFAKDGLIFASNWKDGILIFEHGFYRDR